MAKHAHTPHCVENTPRRARAQKCVQHWKSLGLHRIERPSNSRMCSEMMYMDAPTTDLCSPRLQAVGGLSGRPSCRAAESRAAMNAMICAQPSGGIAAQDLNRTTIYGGATDLV